MYVKQNDQGKWCVDSQDDQVVSEHDTEAEAKAALDKAKQAAAMRMASMVSTVRASGDKGEADVDVLFDTGATLSFVMRSVAEKLATITKMPKPYKIIIGDGSNLSVTDMAVLAIKAAGQTIMDTFLVLENGVEDVVLGEATMRKFGLKIDLEHGTIFSEMKIDKTKTQGERKELSMWKKFLAAIGLSVADEEVSEAQAVELLKSKLAASKLDPPKRPKAVVPAGLLEVLELEEDASESDARGAILALKHSGNPVSIDPYRSLQDDLRAKEIASLVDRACNMGEDEMAGKLYPHEREWAIEECNKDLQAMRVFIARRPKVLNFLAALPGKQSGTVVIDSLQASINEQIGVSKETFVKYNSH